MEDAKPNLIGLKYYKKHFGRSNDKPLAGLREFTINHLFANIWSRPEVSTRDRSMITVALLAAQGHEHELKDHIKGALNEEITEAQILEIMIHVAHYSGWRPQPTPGHSGNRISCELLHSLA